MPFEIRIRLNLNFKILFGSGRILVSKLELEVIWLEVIYLEVIGLEVTGLEMIGLKMIAS